MFLGVQQIQTHFKQSYEAQVQRVRFDEVKGYRYVHFSADELDNFAE